VPLYLAVKMKILLHICCSNCATYPFKILKSEGHDLSGFWFNPNIHPYEEYTLRLDSLKMLSKEWNIDMFYTEEYKPEDFFKILKYPHPLFIKGGQGGIIDIDIEQLSENLLLDSLPPSPERCTSCYLLRLEKTAERAKKQDFDAFSTTLLISPYQEFEQIISAGRKLAEKYNVLFHLEDFRSYFRDSINLAKELGLYRQKYCGCIFSREERKNKKLTNEKRT
jgi:predicted adenine nucleotide alpha hydrolase (AANH) superfamily ATPase